jgi:hypothetical protein
LQVLYLILYMFHTYIASVCSKCFIHFILILHSNVSYCMSFILFGESMDTGTDGGMARVPENRSRQARD